VSGNVGATYGNATVQAAFRRIVDVPEMTQAIHAVLEQNKIMTAEASPGTSYWTIVLNAGDLGRCEVSITTLNGTGEGPAQKAERFKSVLRRIADVSRRYEDPEHALEVVMRLAQEAVRGEP